jgi:hypothetical protein
VPGIVGLAGLGLMASPLYGVNATSPRARPGKGLIRRRRL